MRTSVEITDSLYEQARELAHRRNSTLRELIERGLRKVVREEQDDRVDKKFKLRNITYGKGGLKDEFKDASWEEQLEVIHPMKTHLYK